MVIFVETACASLFNLHDAILNSVNFDRDHLFEFFAGRDDGHRKIVFGEDDDWAFVDGTLADITLSQVYPLPRRLKLYYRFDYGDEWRFEVRKVRKPVTEPVPGVAYPRVIEKIGPNPLQYGVWKEG